MKYANQVLLDDYHRLGRDVVALESTIERMHQNKNIPYYCMAELTDDIVAIRKKQDSLSEVLAIITPRL